MDRETERQRNKKRALGIRVRKVERRKDGRDKRDRQASQEDETDYLDFQRKCGPLP